MCGRSFSICGVNVRLEGDSTAKVDAGSNLFEHFGLESAPSAEVGDQPIRFEITGRDPQVPPRTAAVVANHMDLVVRSSGDLLYVDCDSAAARIDLALGAAELHTTSWPQGPTAGRPYLIFIYTLLTLLRRRGLIPLHAAALKRRGSGVLLVAPSGSGKSTLTLVFLRSGWNIVSDDSVLLRRGEPGGVAAHGLRRDLFLRSPENDFPDLADAWINSTDIDRSKRRLVVERTFPGRVSRDCTPRFILFPELTSRAESCLLPCPPHETLYRLLDHSTVAALEPGAARAHIEVLGKLVRQTRSFVLEAAGDLLDDPDRLRLLVEPMIAGSAEPGPGPGADASNRAPA